MKKLEIKSKLDDLKAWRDSGAYSHIFRDNHNLRMLLKDIIDVLDYLMEESEAHPK